MPSFLDLPRELRQMILGYTFENAIADDLRLNQMLKESWLHFYSRRPQRDGPGFVCDFWTWTTQQHLSCCSGIIDWKKSYAVHISKWGKLLYSVHSDLTDDVSYTLCKALDRFEQSSARFGQKNMERQSLEQMDE